ncbi:hypothetical protein BJ546DRAFT_599039 [Cryomyces antarcticus]
MARRGFVELSRLSAEIRNASRFTRSLQLVTLSAGHHVCVLEAEDVDEAGEARGDSSSLCLSFLSLLLFFLFFLFFLLFRFLHLLHFFLFLLVFHFFLFFLFLRFFRVFHFFCFFLLFLFFLSLLCLLRHQRRRRLTVRLTRPIHLRRCLLIEAATLEAVLSKLTGPPALTVLLPGTCFPGPDGDGRGAAAKLEVAGTGARLGLDTVVGVVLGWGCEADVPCVALLGCSCLDLGLRRA